MVATHVMWRQSLVVVLTLAGALAVPALGSGVAARQAVARPAKVGYVTVSGGRYASKGLWEQRAAPAGLRSAWKRAARAAAPQLRQSEVAAAGQVTDPALLQIPWSQWPKGTFGTLGLTVDARWADNGADNFFASITSGGSNDYIHSGSYADAGMLGGYAQSASIHFDAKDVGSGYWLGSLYSNSDDAQIVVEDVNLTLGTEVQPAACTRFDPPNCRLFEFEWSDVDGHKHIALYEIWSTGNVVGEVAVDSLKGKTPTVNRAITAAAAQLMVAAVHTARMAFRPPLVITIDGLGIVHTVKGTPQTTRTLRVGEQGTFQAVYHVSVAGTYVRWGSVTFTKDSTTLFTMPLHPHILANGTQFMANATNFHRPVLAGYLVAHFVLHVGSATADGTLGFWLQPAPVPSSATFAPTLSVSPAAAAAGGSVTLRVTSPVWPRSYTLVWVAFSSTHHTWGLPLGTGPRAAWANSCRCFTQTVHILPKQHPPEPATARALIIADGRLYQATAQFSIIGVSATVTTNYGFAVRASPQTVDAGKQVTLTVTASTWPPTSSAVSIGFVSAHHSWNYPPTVWGLAQWSGACRCFSEQVRILPKAHATERALVTARIASGGHTWWVTGEFWIRGLTTPSKPSG